MPRYIDAETIPDLFDEKFKETQKLIEAGETQLDNLAEGFAEAEKIVLFKASTADVQEVRHGKWQLQPIDIWYCWECSICHMNPRFYSMENTKYCPNCGAKMDLEESGEKRT